MAEILIYGDVGDPDQGLGAAAILDAINADTGDIVVRINSAGGFIVEGLAIYNAFARAKQAGRKVTVHVDGLAASMASVIAMVGDEIIMADNALMMIHNPLNAAYGDASELRKAADQLDNLRDQILKIYTGQTGLSRQAVMAMMDAETWFTADQALKKRFATAIVGGSRAVNAIDVKPFGFRKLPLHPLIAAIAGTSSDRGQSDPTKKGERGDHTGASVRKELKRLTDGGMTYEDISDELAKISDDASRSAQTLSAIANSEIHNPPETLLEALKTIKSGEAKMTEATAALTTQSTETAAPPDLAAISAKAIADERARGSTIRQAVAKAKLPAAFAEELVDAGTSIDEARAKIIDKLADASDATMPRNQAPIAVGTDEREKFVTGAGNALLARAGLIGIVAAAAKARGETIDLDPGEYRGIRNVELARMALDMAGIAERSYDRDKIVASALTARNSITQTTSDFGVLLENVMHKVLQAAYATAPDTWSRVCGVGSVSDFRPHNRYLRGTFGELDDLNEAGEYRNKPIPDGAKEMISAKTKGNIINLSRQAIVNDDMEAFSGIAVDLGRAAKLSIEIAFYRLLALNAGLGPVMNDGLTLFHATHGNIATPAAPSVVAFDALRVLMARQKDLSGNEFLDIRPSTGLFPTELGGTARVINDSQYDPDAANKLQRPNIVNGLFSDIVDTPRLSGTPWYGFAEKDMAPAIEVVFLNGEQEPFLDSMEGWRSDGTEWKVRLDFGVGAVNWRSAARNAGA